MRGHADLVELALQLDEALLRELAHALETIEFDLQGRVLAHGAGQALLLAGALRGRVEHVPGGGERVRFVQAQLQHLRLQRDGHRPRAAPRGRRLGIEIEIELEAALGRRVGVADLVAVRASAVLHQQGDDPVLALAQVVPGLRETGLDRSGRRLARAAILPGAALRVVLDERLRVLARRLHLGG